MDHHQLLSIRVFGLILLVLLGCGALLTHAPLAHAATFIVTRPDDPAPDGCAPADCSLREAILAANAASGTDIVSLSAGTYRLAIPGINEDGGTTGDLDVSSPIALTGAGAGRVIWPAVRAAQSIHSSNR
jgi:CSLREA domain-containing protein